MSQQHQNLNRRKFIKGAAALASLTFLPSATWASIKQNKLRTAHIGVGGMGMEDLKSMTSHPSVDVIALCDVDSDRLKVASKMHPKAKLFADYRKMMDSMAGDIDAVVVSTPDHTHAPASIRAMEMGKAVYCQKPLTHHVTESRAMAKLAKDKNLITQMGIQVHSFYDYKLATHLIQSGIIGKVSTVHAWSPKNWGYDGPLPTGKDPIPKNLDWNLWLGTAQERNYKNGMYHPGNWRKLMDYGCGTLGDMGVHIFDTPYNALQLDVPRTIKNTCRLPNGFGYPERNQVTYEFPGTPYTTESLTWIWYDGEGAPATHEDLRLPNNETLPDQGAMFIGEKGRLLLPHFQQLPRLIVEGKYEDLEIDKYDTKGEFAEPVRDYTIEGNKHYQQFTDACLDNGSCTAPFSYAARLTETILLGVIAGRFPGETLNWDREKALFAQSEANPFLDGNYRKF